MDDKILNNVALSAVHIARAARLHKKPVLALFSGHVTDPLLHVSQMLAHYSVLSAVAMDRICGLGLPVLGSNYEQEVDVAFGEYFGRKVREYGASRVNPEENAHELAKLIRGYVDDAYAGCPLPPTEQRKIDEILNNLLGWPELELLPTPSLYTTQGEEIGASRLMLTFPDAVYSNPREFLMYGLYVEKPADGHFTMTIGGHTLYVRILRVTVAHSIMNVTHLFESAYKSIRDSLETVMKEPVPVLMKVTSILENEWVSCLPFKDVPIGEDIAPVWNSDSIYRKTGDQGITLNRGAGVASPTFKNFLCVLRDKLPTRHAANTGYSVKIGKTSPAPINLGPVTLEVVTNDSLENETSEVREALNGGILAPEPDAVARGDNYARGIFLALLQPWGSKEQYLRVFSATAGTSTEEKLEMLKEVYNGKNREVLSIQRITKEVRAMLCASLSHPKFIDFS